MTAKRFEYIMFDGFEDDGEFMTPHDVANLLNEFYEKNQELEKENGQLKSELDFIKDENKHMRDLVNKNKQLKQQNENLLAKLKFTAEQLNYSENLRKMFDGDVE